MCRHITTDHSETPEQSAYLPLASVTLTTLHRSFPVNNCSLWVTKLHPASWGYMSPSLDGLLNHPAPCRWQLNQWSQDSQVLIWSLL